MKKLWRKFKEWLIKKLGGCVMPLKVIEPKIEYYYARPITLFARKTVDLNFFDGDRVYQEQLIKKAIADELANELLKRGLVEIVTEDDLIYWKRLYKARVMVYAEKGADDEQREAD